MNVCVVGNGPSAEGRGAEIDACDFVVRIKAWWRHGAADAGTRIDAWAWYGCKRGLTYIPPFRCQNWFTHCPKQTQSHGSKIRRARRKSFLEHSSEQRTQFLTDVQWQTMRSFTGKHPSTGMVAVFMAIERFPDCNLHLYGFDSTRLDQPNFFDARRPDLTPKDPHCQQREKTVFRRINTGMWLNNPTKVTLTWPDMPRMDG